MGKLPKQYKRKDGETSPEKVDVDDELERQFSRSNRERSAERDREKLREKKEERKIVLSKSSRKRSRSRDRKRSRSREKRRDRSDRERKRGSSRDRKRSKERKRSRSRSRDRRRRRRSGSKERKSRASLEREVQEKSKETGIAVPEYLARPAEQSKFLEAQAKRKLLWGNKNKETEAGKVTEQQKIWANLSVGDGKTTSKFQKLMGANKLQVDEGEGKEAAEKLIEKQKTMFNAFENQYANARQQTHFSKGKGFGL
ncbi:unnamed protein product [Oikopleura dioica]|uniref:Arginine/serine-rich coiled-coil protein 2 n=1 Tax=Oikopleura dioica TaxID=34765 RepID=E4XKC8_OIKDI|nr:unnamed protein product [Oikopleura dioica]